MPEEDRREAERQPARGPERKRFAPAAVPAYLWSIIAIFIGPALVLLAKLWKRIPKVPFFASVAAISIIGWAWSWTVSRNLWWSFGERYMLGWEVVPHLPLEEFLFYPFGGMLCLLVYISRYRPPGPRRPVHYWVFMTAGTALFAVLAWATRANGPYYLYSQFLVYNALCGLLLAPFAAKEVDMRALWAPVALLGSAGFGWDYVAFTYGWWDYHAITRIRVSIVPVDDFNFFLYAPAAAVSIYHCLCRLMGSAPVKDA